MNVLENSKEYFDGFAWAVPFAFADALAACRFERGDILYDTKRAYEGPWDRIRRHISYSIQVEFPSRAPVVRSREQREAKKSVFRSNWEQPVSFHLTHYLNNEADEITTTQGRLYTLLWEGNRKWLDEKTDAPPVPILAKGVLGDIQKAVPYFRKSVFGHIKTGAMFLMPYDSSRLSVRSKFARLNANLKTLRPRIELASPEEAGVMCETRFAPTVKIACFCVEGTSVSELDNKLKGALYTRAKKRETYRIPEGISAHGYLAAL